MSLPLEITADGVVVGEAVAIVPREDLQALGYGTGRYGFRVGVPIDLTRPINLHFRVAGTDFRSEAFKFGTNAVLTGGELKKRAKSALNGVLGKLFS